MEKRVPEVGMSELERIVEPTGPDGRPRAIGRDRPDAERALDRRRFLGGAALVGVAAMACGGGPALGVSARPGGLGRETGGPTGYSSDAYLNVRSFGARGDGMADDTAAIQKALDAAGKQGGNVVLLPTGRYLVGGSLRVPRYVTLQGVFRAPTSTQPLDLERGSCLLAVGGKGKADGEPLISMSENATLYGLKVFYPEQTCPDPPVEYPWTVRYAGNNGNASVVNVTLVNPWQGVHFGPVAGGRYYIHGLYGQPLKTGLFIEHSYDTTRVEDVHFWPFWRFGKTGRWTTNEATAFRIGRADWLYMLNCFCIWYKIGYHFIHSAPGKVPGGSPGGDPNVVLTQCGADGGWTGTKPTAVRVDASQNPQGISFVNGQFDSYPGGPTVAVGPRNSGPVKFTNCGFWSGPDIDTIAVLEGSGNTTFMGCQFPSWGQKNRRAPAILLRSGRLTVEGCEFMEAGKAQAVIEHGAEGAVVVGNHFYGPARITNQAGDKAVIGLNAVG